MWSVCYWTHSTDASLYQGGFGELRMCYPVAGEQQFDVCQLLYSSLVAEDIHLLQFRSWVWVTKQVICTLMFPSGPLLTQVCWLKPLFQSHPFENNHNNIHGSFHGCDPPNLKPLRIETLRPGAWSILPASKMHIYSKCGFSKIKLTDSHFMKLEHFSNISFLEKNWGTPHPRRKEDVIFNWELKKSTQLPSALLTDLLSSAHHCHQLSEHITITVLMLQAKVFPQPLPVLWEHTSSLRERKAQQFLFTPNDFLGFTSFLF